MVKITPEAVQIFIKKLALGKWHGPTQSGFGAYQIRINKFLKSGEWPDLSDVTTITDPEIRALQGGILIDDEPAGKLYLRTQKIFSGNRRILSWNLAKKEAIENILIKLLNKINVLPIKAKLQTVLDDIQTKTHKHVGGISANSDSPLALWRVANKRTMRDVAAQLGISSATYSMLETGRWRPRPTNTKWVAKLGDLTCDPETFNKMLAWYEGESPKIELATPKIYLQIVDQYQEYGYTLQKVIDVLSLSIPKERVIKFINRQAYPNTFERQSIAAMLGDFTAEEVAVMDFES